MDQTSQSATTPSLQETGTEQPSEYLRLEGSSTPDLPLFENEQYCWMNRNKGV